MKGFIGLTKRNLLIFFKDRQSVVFSLLTSIIVLGLYLLFLKGTFVDSMNEIIGSYPTMSELISESEIDMFVNLVLLTGILGSAMITVSYNCLTTLVKDRENRIDYDILATPVKRGQIIMSYFVSATLSSIILTGIILAVGLFVIQLQGDIYMGAAELVGAFGIVALGSVSATAFFMILILFFKSTGASGAFFGMLSAASGFVIGAFVPISQFSDGVQTVCNIFPASQVTSVLRNTLMNGILDHMETSLNGVDNGMFSDAIKNLYSFNAHLFDHEMTVGQMLVYVGVGIAVCIVVQIIVYSATYKKK